LGQDYDWQPAKIRGTAIFVFTYFGRQQTTQGHYGGSHLASGLLSGNTPVAKRRIPTHPAILKNNKGSIKGLAEPEAFCYIFFGRIQMPSSRLFDLSTQID
jgi:hypothetical protein